MAEPKDGVEWARNRLAAARAQWADLVSKKRPNIWGIAAIVGGVAALAAVIGVWAFIYWGLPSVPNAQALWSINRQPGVTFLDREGRVLGVRGPYYSQRVSLEELPSYVPHAFLAIEDRRFYEHAGIDRAAIIRAFFANLQAGRTVQGGSTITQQLARNLFLNPRQTVRRKVQEMVIASRIEQLLSKDDILELYLNRLYLGERAFGVDAAARRYFGRPATELTLAQAAILAGLPKAPSRSAPTENLERAQARQRLVLQAMVEARYITAEQRDAAAAEEIEIVGQQPENDLGYVFDLAFARACDEVGRDRRAREEEAGAILCPREEGADRRYPPQRRDLVIRLTVDANLQRAAGRSVREHLGARANNREHPLQAAFLAVDREGGVRALVGGANYSRSKFNRVVQARRQPGSAFKAFVYAAALREGLDTEDVRYDEPIVIGNWRPRNYDEGYRGAVTLRTAFALSLNTVAAQVTDEVGPRRVADLAASFGISTMPRPREFVPTSIALGTKEVTLWDMTQAFSVFMHQGVRIESHLVDSIASSSGEELYRYQGPPPERVYDQALSQQMTSLLGAVVLRGTGTRAQMRGRDVAGKTGTSQDWRDAWFVGYTADYTAGAWVGLDDFTPMNRVRGVGRITGGAIPAEIWNDVMTVAHRDLPARPLPGIEQPRRSERQLMLADFYNSLREAFGANDFPVEARPPPDDYFR
ncbi:MAG: PBP1A family penicillin-binding protein [Alphaproteobacteria bacterium]|nr:PBP1A family penicillin-binding protein [Alphaproteobacteria bacterium]